MKAKQTQHTPARDYVRELEREAHAVEVRQLRAVNADLLAALEQIRDSPQFRNRLENGVQQIVYAAIARARREA